MKATFVWRSGRVEEREVDKLDIMKIIYVDHFPPNNWSKETNRKLKPKIKTVYHYFHLHDYIGLETSFYFEYLANNDYMSKEQELIHERINNKQ